MGKQVPNLTFRMIFPNLNTYLPFVSLGFSGCHRLAEVISKSLTSNTHRKRMLIIYEIVS